MSVFLGDFQIPQILHGFLKFLLVFVNLWPWSPPKTEIRILTSHPFRNISEILVWGAWPRSNSIFGLMDSHKQQISIKSLMPARSLCDCFCQGQVDNRADEAMSNVSMVFCKTWSPVEVFERCHLCLWMEIQNRQYIQRLGKLKLGDEVSR